MANVETNARLDLVQLAARCLGTGEPADDRELIEAIEALCERRELPVGACLTPERARILSARSGGEFEGLLAVHGIDPPS